MNELWTYDTTTQYIATERFPNIVNPNRMFSTAYANMKFTRQDLGIIYRLSLPVTIFLVIVGLSFWADIEKRIDVTLQMLLVVAALYLIVGQVIPFVGYLTTMDIFITVVFLLLSITVGIHFLTLVMDRKKDKYPLNAFYRDLLVYFFKAVWIPMAMLVFVLMFEIQIAGILIAMYGAFAATFLDAVFHIAYLKRSFKVAVINLRLKVSRVNSGKVINKINTAHTTNDNKNDNKTDEIDAEKEDEIKYGKDVRLTLVEKEVYRLTLTYYVDEPKGFNPVTGKINHTEKPDHGTAGEGAAAVAEYDLRSSIAINRIRAQSMHSNNNSQINKSDNIAHHSSDGQNRLSVDHADIDSATANPMRFSVSLQDVVDSDDEEHDHNAGHDHSNGAPNYNNSLRGSVSDHTNSNGFRNSQVNSIEMSAMRSGGNKDSNHNNV